MGLWPIFCVFLFYSLDHGRESRLFSGCCVWLYKIGLCRLVELGICFWKKLHRLALVACDDEFLDLLGDLGNRVAAADIENSLLF